MSNGQTSQQFGHHKIILASFLLLHQLLANHRLLFVLVEVLVVQFAK